MLLTIDQLPAKRILIVEDEPAIADTLCYALSTEGFEPEHFQLGRDALTALQKQGYALALLDIGLPGMSGLEGIRILHERQPQLLLLVLTVFDDDARIFQALCVGAAGYLLKKTPPDRLLESLREVVAGGAPMSPEVARRVVHLFRKFQAPAQSTHELTPHETRILKLLVEGHNYKTAALELAVSVNTISFHVRHIYDKLQVHSKSEAVAKALRSNLV